MNQDQSTAVGNLAETRELPVRGDRWMATLAHELRNPLGAIMLSLEELGPVCAPDTSAFLTWETAMASAEHMARVIDGALDICRARRDELRSETEPVDLGRIVAAAIRNSQPVISRKKHQMTLDLPLGKTAVQGHATRLELIVTNLLTNSAKYTNPGGRISIVIEIAANVVTLRVRDNGIGIASDSLPKIFEPYWKGPASDGLGIGLALVKSLVELLGGSIAVHSDGPGLGAEFAVHLPSACNHH